MLGLLIVVINALAAALTVYTGTYYMLPINAMGMGLGFFVMWMRSQR